MFIEIKREHPPFGRQSNSKGIQMWLERQVLPLRTGIGELKGEINGYISLSFAQRLNGGNNIILQLPKEL